MEDLKGSENFLNTSFHRKRVKCKDVIFSTTQKMAYLLKDSPECGKSELELFNLPPTQTCIERGQWTEFHLLEYFWRGSCRIQCFWKWRRLS